MRILFLETHPMWIHGLPNGFCDAGHEVMVPETINENTIHTLFADFKPDLALAVSWTFTNVATTSQQYINHAARKANVPLIYWDTEGPTHFENVIVPLLQTMRPDFVFTIYPDRVNDYVKLGFKSAVLEFGYHPQVHFSQEKDLEFASPVAIVANSYYELLKEYARFYRLRILKMLLCPILKMGIQVNFYGTGWEKMDELLGVTIPKEWIKGSLSYELVNKVYASADVILGPQNEAKRVSQRTYEILASGGFLLTVDSPGTKEVGVSGRDFVATNSHATTAKLIDYYLNHPEQRRQIQENGKLAVRSHSYKNRAEYMIDVLKNEKWLNIS